MTRPVRRRRRWVLAVAAVYAVGLAFVLFWPVHVDGEGGLIEVHWLVGALAVSGVPIGLRYALVESFLNMVLFFPLGALWVASFRWPRPRSIATAAALGLGVSVVAEAVQLYFLPERTVDVRDVISNTAGAALGALTAVLLARARQRSRERAADAA